VKKKMRYKMNIFATSYCPLRSAQALDDKRLNKMILETLQMLFMALDSHGVGNLPYKSNKAHMKHPCTLWVASNYYNYLWTLDHFISLLNERKFRFPDKDNHKCGEYMAWVSMERDKIPKTSENKDIFVNCS